MTENEFLQILNEQLTGQMSASAAASHIEYYRNYIHDEIRKGRKEEDVLKNLGDPRLMARTILDTTPKSGPYTATYPEGGNPSGIGSVYSGSGSGQFRKRRCRLDLTTWYSRMIVIGIAAVVIILLFILLGILIPIAAVIFLVVWIASWFRKK